jgi:hypothetical protein
MDYVMSVGRANTLLSTKTARTEAVKAGLRIALAEPTRLFDTCGTAGGTTPVGLTTSFLDVPVSTLCYKLNADALSLNTLQVRYGLATVQKDQSVPPVLVADTPPKVPYVSPNPTSTSAWFADTTLHSDTNKVWLPDLPVHGLSPRSPLGWDMPAAYVPTGYTSCKVYFPGTYTNPVTIKGPGPTYFASGIYYFENTLLITDGADVVIGGGVTEGCTTDQFAAFYATNAPSTHNINGLGATFVFGGGGHLVVANDVGPAINVQFNRRYVESGDLGAAPSADVSILSVNGQLGLDGLTGEALKIDGVLEVPLSHVGQEIPAPVTVPPTVPLPPATPPPSATAQKYLPSTLVPPPAPTVPDPPTSMVLTPYLTSMRVAWTLPVGDGGSQITKYTVRVASPVGITSTCETQTTAMCVVPSLPLGVPPTQYTFTVEATNAVGTSALLGPSAPTATGVLIAPAWSPGTLPILTGPTPIIDFALTTATPVTVHVPGYVSIPQGRFRLTNPNGLNVTLAGGLLAASMTVVEPLRVPVPVGLSNPVVQRTFRIITETTTGTPHMVSSAIVQVNQGGGWEINSWEVQAN